MLFIYTNNGDFMKNKIIIVSIFFIIIFLLFIGKNNYNEKHIYKCYTKIVNNGT